MQASTEDSLFGVLAPDDQPTAFAHLTAPLDELMEATIERGRRGSAYSAVSQQSAAPEGRAVAATPTVIINTLAAFSTITTPQTATHDSLCELISSNDKGHHTDERTKPHL